MASRLFYMLACAQLLLHALISAQQLEGSGVSSDENVKLWKIASNADGGVPICANVRKKGRFSSEICNIVQTPQSATDPTVVFQYCACARGVTCSRSARTDDAHTYAHIGDLQFKTCLPEHQLPVCHDGHYSIVAKVWYGEDLPLKVITHCRCPKGSLWGQLRCTSSGRICYVLNCANM